MRKILCTSSLFVAICATFFGLAWLLVQEVTIGGIEVPLLLLVMGLVVCGLLCLCFWFIASELCRELRKRKAASE